MTNKKFKKAAMALALTACVAATPLAANAETPENAADVQAPAAVDHTEADTQEAPEAELPVEEKLEAQPAAEAAAQPAAPEATPIAVELPTAEETPEDEEAPEEKEETPVEVTPTEDAVVEKETPAKVAPAPAEADVDNLIEDPDADIATMDGAEKEVSKDEATIDGTSYGTLQGAIDSAKEGQTVVLQKNHKGNIKIAEWIKLNLNGKKIEGNVDVDLSKKQDDTATSQDGETAVEKKEKKVEIVGGTITGGTDSGVKIIGADVKLENVNVTGNSSQGNGGGIYVEDGSVEIIGGSISGNSAAGTNERGAQGGGGIYAKNSDVVLTDTTISGNTVTGSGKDGGGVLVKNGSLTINDSTISDNTAPDQGGGIHVEWSELKITDSTVSGNKAANGAGIFMADTDVPKNETEHTITKTTIENNTASNLGGGVYVGNNSDVTITDSTLEGNTAASQGGAIVAYSGRNITLDNTTVKGNKAISGGGIFSSGGTVTVEDSTFEKNTATDDGGAIAATQNSSLTVRNSKVLENKAADTAGGILAEKSTLEVTDSIIDGNRASVGGGLYIADIDAPGETKEDKPEHTITRTEITNNTADGQGIGGGIYLGAQKLTITDSKLTGNNTISKNGQTQGGAIVAYSPGDFTLDNTLIQGNTADVGGSIHVLSTKLRDSHIILCNNTRITGNVANLFGGGIFLDNMNNPAVLELVNASVDNNTANVAGGIGNYGSIVVLKDGAVLENNTAKQYGGGLYNRGKVTVESGATVMNNTASTYGGGLYNKGEATVESGAKLYNNHAALAGDDIYLAGKNSTLTLTKVGDDWMLDDCGHKINGWFADLLDARWDADGKQEHVINLKDYAADGLTIVENEDGSYTITILDENATLALKAAHNVTPKPTPDPDPEPTPGPDTPDTPVSPEDPTTPPVQDVTPDEAETPVNPENPSNPPVQDATPDSTVAALPKTGVNWFTALAMALSGMALTVAGAFTSLFAKSKH